MFYLTIVSVLLVTFFRFICFELLLLGFNAEFEENYRMILKDGTLWQEYGEMNQWTIRPVTLVLERNLDIMNSH